MKKSLLSRIVMAFAVIGLVFSSCKEEVTPPVLDLTVTISEISVTPNSVTVKLTPNADVAKYRFAIGNANDLNNFHTLIGTIFVNGNQPTTHTFSDLTPKTSYTVFALAEDANGNASNIQTLVVTTAEAPDTEPNVTVTFPSITTILADVTTTPNSLVSKYYSLIIAKGLYPDFVELWAEGDKVAFMEMMAEFEMADINTAAATATWELNGETNYEYLFLVLMFDKDGNTSEDLLLEIDFKSPNFKDGLPEASATIAVSEITTTTARVKITPGTGTYGYYAGILTAAEYATYVTDEDFASLRQELAFYGFLGFGIDDDTWGLDGGTTDYVVVVSPFNDNGIHGYGPFATKAFSTTGSGVAPKSIAIVKNKAMLDVKAKTKGKITKEKLINKK